MTRRALAVISAVVTSFIAFFGMAVPAHAADSGVRVTYTLGVAYNCDRMLRFEVHVPSASADAWAQLTGLTSVMQGQASEPGLIKLQTCESDPDYYGVMSLQLTVEWSGQRSVSWIKVDVGGKPPVLKLTVKVKGRTISGTFVDPSAYAKGYNTITFYRGAKVVYSMKTDSKNAFTKTVKPGVYLIKAKSIFSPRVAPVTKQVTIR